jgi:O-antigen ligase
MSVSSPIAIIAIALFTLIAIAGLFRPRLGLLVFLAIYFAQPGEVVPSLAPLRIELIYGVLIFSIFLTRRRSVGTLLMSDRIVRAAVIFLFVAALTVPLAIWRGGAFDALIYLTKLIVLLILLSGSIESNGQLKTVLWLLAGVLVWFAGSGLLAYSRGQYYELNYTLGNLERARGISSIASGPNELAGIVLTLLPFLVALFRISRAIFLKILLLACGAFGVAAMVLTGSRSAMIALGGVILYYAWSSKHRLISFAACFVLVCVIWFAMPSSYQQRILTVKSYAAGGQLDDSNAYRLEVWKAGWRMFMDHPSLGVGAGQFSTAFGLIYSGKEHGAWMNPHNLLIQVACEFGLIGLIAFGYFVFQIAKAIFGVLRYRTRSDVRLNYHVAVACNAMFVAILLISVVGHSLYRPYWYLLAGLAAANRTLAFGLLRKETAKVVEPSGVKDVRKESGTTLPQPYPQKLPG